MPRRHRVRQGDCISSIAFEAGFLPATLWEHPSNAQLRQLRQDENYLFPGDAVHVPDLRLREETGATDARHRFRRRGVPKQVRIQLIDIDEPLANLAVEVVVDEGAARSLSSDGDGWLTIPIVPNARTIRLSIDGELAHVLQLGHLDPAAETSGVQGRLMTLGFYAGALDGRDSAATKAALVAFQRAEQLEESGESDDATRARLVERVGS